MPRKEGSVLIGFAHRGKENAGRAVAELRKEGIKRGDVVVVEDSKKDWEEIKKRIESEAIKSEIRKTEAVIASVDKDLRAKPDRQTRAKLKIIKTGLIAVRESLVFHDIFCRFLIEKGVKVLPMGSEAMLRRHTTSVADLAEAAVRGIKIPRKQKVLNKFIQLPIREKRFKKVLQANNPKFVVTGSRHFAVVKKMVPFRRAVNLDPGPLIVRAWEKAADGSVRFRYRMAKAKSARGRRKNLLARQRALARRL